MGLMDSNVGDGSISNSGLDVKLRRWRWNAETESLGGRGGGVQDQVAAIGASIPVVASGSGTAGLST